ncbi:HlyU family transcriptional regulator [Gammaproteobacteria bacterium]|nr:HlyU family transcriptional regulator [Gammaproteobacteria bacterium]
MALGKFLKSLFSGSAGDGQPSPSESIDYKGLSIEAAPINEDGKYRTAGFISGEVDGETRRIRFIRADQNADLGSAVNHSITKAQQIIDEQGESLLNKTQL